MKRSSVYHAIAGNPAPTAPDMNNARPLPGSHQSTSLYFSWGKVIDAHPPVSYSLFISTDMTPDHSNATYVLENIGANHAAVGPEAGLLINTPYYWKVRVIDRYGAYSDSSPIMNFDTPSLNNADVVILTGTVLDSVTAQPIRASIDISNTQTAVADVDGSYYFPNLGTVGNFTVTTTATGYTPETNKPITIVSQGRLTTFMHDVALVPEPDPTSHTVNVIVDGVNGGSGTVSSGIGQGSIVCHEGSTGVCSAYLLNTQPVSLTPAPNTGSIFSSWSDNCVINGLACTFTDMSVNRNVTATFVKTPPFKRPSAGGYAYELQSTYDDPSTTDPIIQMQETIPEGTFTAAINKTVTLQGGYDADFTPDPSGTFTTIQGKLTVQNGTLRVERVRVR